MRKLFLRKNQQATQPWNELIRHFPNLHQQKNSNKQKHLLYESFQNQETNLLPDWSSHIDVQPAARMENLLVGETRWQPSRCHQVFGRSSRNAPYNGRACQTPGPHLHANAQNVGTKSWPRGWYLRFRYGWNERKGQINYDNSGQQTFQACSLLLLLTFKSLNNKRTTHQQNAEAVQITFAHQCAQECQHDVVFTLTCGVVTLQPHPKIP